MRIQKALVVLGVVGFATAAAAFATFDFGEFRDHHLDAHSLQVFGVVSPVEASSTRSITAQEANADPTALVTLAKGLRARVVSARADLGANIDMMAFWPNDHNPTHIIACNEQGTAQPGVQRIRLSDGAVETILTGTNSCDPVRRTAWGTIVVGEESGNTGWLLEIINPLGTTGVSFNRAMGTFSGGVGTTNIATRPAVGRLSFEGLALLPNGMMYYGDENRPGTGTPGGAYFKFIPSTSWNGGGSIAALSQSPLVSGAVYGLRLGKRSSNTDYGQGTQTGRGIWVPITPNAGNNVDLRAATALLKLTGYYRPEDAEVDPAALAEGKVRFCANNTGNEIDDNYWGETICVTDGSVAQALANTAVPEAQLFVVGTPELAMMDNLAYQPGRGNWILHEDGDGPEVGRNNDLWACAEDGSDFDSLSDGCIRVATINDLNAEWTGGFFDPWGEHLYISVQHNVTGHGVILDIYGWR
ncbi:MAG TPA: alkaline phosphatase PhoX [Terriglobia bacterium]|nr:alkaline phosphatase PhoX [Terriglobia bacterium]